MAAEAADHERQIFAVVRAWRPDLLELTGVSGQTTRFRLDRYGDRQLNRAIHTIVLSRLRYDEATRAYRDRRRAEGKTDREIERCLKRYVARQLYRQLEGTPSNA